MKYPLIKSSRATALFLLAALSAGCAHPYTTAEVNRTWLKFVQDNSTTRQQVVAAFGEPTASFEKGRIVTYRLIGPLAPQTDDVFFTPLEKIPPTVAHSPEPLDEVSWSARLEWSLVLVYDGQQVVRRHSVIRRL